MKHSLRLQLTFTYVAGVLLSVMLAYAAGHLLDQLSGVPFQFPHTDDSGFLLRLLVTSTLVSLALGYVMANDMTRRIANLAAAAMRISAGELGTHIPTRHTWPDEIDQLGVTFNEMADRLQQSMARQQKLEQARRDLVANVAHDLRTPVAAVQAAVEALEEGVVRDEATAARYLKAIGQETRHLGRLIDDLFALSRLEAGQLEIKLEAVYLENVLQDCLVGLMPRLERAGIALAVDLPATLPPVRADRHATGRILNNLLHNALAFTPAQGQITVRGACAAAAVEIEVHNSGPGISPEGLEPGSDGLPHIFDRFYQGDQARSGGGAGLGLTIVRELVQAQGGRIWVKSQEGQGATIAFTLPAEE